MIRRNEESALARLVDRFFTGGTREGDHEPCVVIYGGSQEMAVVEIQLGSGQIHASPPYVVHRINHDLAKLTLVVVLWGEAPIGLFDDLEKVRVQRGVWNAELDNNLPTFNGVTGSALTCCCGNGLAC